MQQGQLGFDSMPRKLVRVTPAKLATWGDCPRRYRMTYLDRPTPPRGAPWAHATLGAVVHNALRAFFDLPVAKRTPSAAAALVVGNWHDDGFSNGMQAADPLILALGDAFWQVRLKATRSLGKLKVARCPAQQFVRKRFACSDNSPAKAFT